MKKILIATLILVCSVSVKAQFPTTDSLRAFVNRWIRNSAVEAFQNLRLNTALIGMTNFVDSSYGGQVRNFYAVNDSTANLVTTAYDTFTVLIRGNGISGLRRRAGTDSVEYLRAGSWQFAYIDSVGTATSGITQLTGDVTSGPGSGSQAATLATVNSNVGSYTNANITVNAKGLITAAANGSAGAQNIQQTLDIGDTSNRSVIYKPNTDSTDDIYTMSGIPSNFGTSYSGHGVAMGFSSGWQRFNGVNAPNPRPNIVYNVLQYNTTNGGGRINSSEAALRFGVETHFETGGADLFEVHWPEVTTYSGVVKRPFTQYINKATAGTAYNFYALDGFNTQATNGDVLFSFNGTGNYDFVGHGSNSQITLYDESLAGSRYQLQVDGSDVFHNSFGNLQRFDAEIYLDDPYTNSPNLYVHDYRATNNTAGIFLDLNGSNAKQPIRMAATVAGGTDFYLENTGGANSLSLKSNVMTFQSVSNTNPTDPAGSGHNVAYSEYTAGNSAAAGYIGVNYGTSPNRIGSQFYCNAIGIPYVWYQGTTENMRLSTAGGLSVNSLATGGSAPTTSGTTRMVISDVNGLLSFTTIPAGSIASINSQTGPAITLTGGIGTYTSAPSANTIAYNVDPTSDIFSRTIDAIITTAQNTGTGETDLFTKTIAGGTLNTDKQTINFEIDGEVNDATATATLKLYLGGNVTLNTGAVNISTALTAWRLKGYIIRTSSSTAHVTYELHCPGLATPVFVGYNNLTSLDFTTTNVFKITAQAGGAGGGTGDITAHSWQVLYKPQP